MQDGVSLARAQAELTGMSDGLKREYRAEEDGLGFKLVRPGFAGEFLGGPVNGFLIGVMVLAGIVLLAACANLGGLFALRTMDRKREIRIGMALGSNRGGMCRHLLVAALL